MRLAKEAGVPDRLFFQATLVLVGLEQPGLIRGQECRLGLHRGRVATGHRGGDQLVSGRVAVAAQVPPPVLSKVPSWVG